MAEYISGLVDFIKLISNRPFMLEKEQRDNRYLSKYNDTLKEAIGEMELIDDLSSTSKAYKEKLSSFVEKYGEYIYSFGYRTQYEQRKNDHLVFFYRGVSNYTYPIVPGIYRRNEKHEENYYFNEISVRCPDVFRTLSNLEKLTYMQHYGCPTRLLDITSNPLVALYFSCCGNAEEQGVVYVFGVNSEDVLYANSDRIQMLSTFAEFRKEEQEMLRLNAYRRVIDRSFPLNRGAKYRVKEVEQFYHAVKRHNSGFEREIVPFDLLKPQFVQPNKDNPRILKQDGAFIISALDKNDTESDMKLRKALVEEIYIDPKAKAQILQELEYIGINQATLFPEVEKVADYLRKRPY